MNKHSLRQQLVLPFVFLVIFVSAAIGWVSFRAGENAVSELTERILVDVVGRISAATEQHLAGALIALRAVGPEPNTVPKGWEFSDKLNALEERFWIASGLFRAVNNFVYYGGNDGRFAGVDRINPDAVQVFIGQPDTSKRVVYSAKSPGDRSRILRVEDYDPRTRPWYRAAIANDKPVWSPIYNDYVTKQPTVTLAKAVRRADRSVIGVLATDVRLHTLTDFLRTLSVSKNGVAFLMDSDGYLIASSGTELPLKTINGVSERMRASEMKTGLIRDAYAKVLDWQREGADLHRPFARGFWNDGDIVEVGVARFGEKYGVNWLTVVVAPRSDFMGDVKRSLYQGLFIGGVCVLIALALGVNVLNRVLRDIRALTNAAQQVSNGEPLPALNIHRHDELGLLAQTFSEMEHSLRIDKLTAVFNRESLNAQVAFLHRQAEHLPGQKISFALLFIDLDHFKSINDHYGHAAGDQALIAVAARLKSAVCATDVVARYGGDEFVVLLKGIANLDDVVDASGKILDIVEEPIKLEHGIVRVGVSLGWAMFPEDGTDTKTLLKVADSRMFQTKKVRKAAR
jgi:diguanylate cyclase (GGDEF)-like protein